DDYDAFTIIADHPLLLAPGGRFVLGRDTATLNGGASVDYAYGAAFPLVESSDEITLYDAGLVPVDRVAWTPEHQLPYAVGASAALRSPFVDRSDFSNWCTSVTAYGPLGELGTPGTANACEVVEDPTATTEAPTTTSTTTTTTTQTPTRSTTTSTTSSTTTSSTTTSTTSTTTLPAAPT